MYVMLGLSHVTHLLTLLTDYLSLKLPYEIVPPSRGISYPSIRKSATTKALPLSIPPDPSTPSPSKAWLGRKLKDIPQLESLIEAMSLLAWDIAWVLWTQQIWPPVPTCDEPLEACHIAKNLLHLVSSTKIGRISHASTIEFLPTEEVLGNLPQFVLSVKSVQDVISSSLDEKGGDVEGGGWDMVEGGEEVLRGDGWLKLNPVAST
jgi:Vacuolar sorting 38 and autophagy-related subunit 14